MDEDPTKWTQSQRLQLGEMCARAHKLIEAESLTLGQGLARAAAQMGITLDEHLEAAALVALFRVITSGGVEEALRASGSVPSRELH